MWGGIWRQRVDRCGGTGEMWQWVEVLAAGWMEADEAAGIGGADEEEDRTGGHGLFLRF